MAGGSGPARRPGGRDPRLRRHRRGGIARRVAPPIGRPVAPRHPARRARPLARAARGVRRPQRPDRRPLRRVRPEPRRLARRHGPRRGRPGGPAADIRRPTACRPGAREPPPRRRLRDDLRVHRAVPAARSSRDRVRHVLQPSRRAQRPDPRRDRRRSTARRIDRRRRLVEPVRERGPDVRRPGGGHGLPRGPHRAAPVTRRRRAGRDARAAARRRP